MATRHAPAKLHLIGGKFMDGSKARRTRNLRYKRPALASHDRDRKSVV